MITKELLDYMRGEIAKGTPNAVIQQQLATQGWTAADMSEALSALNGTAKSRSFATSFPMSTPPSESPIMIAENPSGSAILHHHKKKHRLLTTIIVLLLLAGGGTIYAYFAGYLVSIESIASDAFTATMSAKSAKYTTTITLDDSAAPGNLLSTLGAPVFDFANGSVTLDGAYDVSTPETPAVDATISAQFGPMAGMGELRVLDKTMYGEITGLPAIPFDPNITSAANQWFSFDYGVNALPTLPKGFNSPLFQGLTPEQETSIAKLAADTHFITITKRMLPETIGDIPTYHFAFDINRANIVQFANALGSMFPAMDLSRFGTALSSTKNFSGEAWIGTKDHLPYKISLNFDEQAGSDPTNLVSVTIVSTFSDWNAPVTVTAPIGAIDVESLLQAAQAKAADTKAESLLADVETQATRYQSSNKNSYKGFCTASDTMNTLSTLPVAACRDNASSYILFVTLQATNGFACIDSKGSVSEVPAMGAGKFCTK